MASAASSRRIAVAESAHVLEFFEPLRNGVSVFKISNGGKPVKRHLQISPDLSTLKWIPSKRKSDSEFVAVGEIPDIHPGFVGSRFEKYGDAGSQPAVKSWLADRAAPGRTIELMSGQLEKLGGAHGGRKSWASRWFIALGTKIFYYATPGDAVSKKDVPIDIDGSVVLPQEDGLSFKLEWPDGSQPVREFRAFSPDDRDRWVAMLKKAVKLNMNRTVGRPASMTSPGKSDSEGPLDTYDETIIRTAEELSALGPFAESQVSCSLMLPGDTTGKGPVSFVFPSLPMFDRWYGGLHRARCLLSNMTAATRQTQYVGHLETFDDDAVVRVLLGEALEELGEVDSALDCYLASSIAQPRLPSARRAAGRVLLNSKKNFSEALPHLEAAAALLERDDFGLMIMLGEARLKSKQVRPALSAFVFACALDTRSAAQLSIAALTGAGDCLALLGRNEEALARYRSALKLDNKSILLHKKLAGLLLLLGKEKEAAVHTAEIASIELKQAPFHELQAKELVSAGKYMDSLPHWDVVARAHVDDVQRLLAATEAYILAEKLKGTKLDASSCSADTEVAVAGAGETEAEVNHSRMSSIDLLSRAEELIVKVLTDDAASPEGNVACGKLYDRLAALELEQLKASLALAGSSTDDAAEETAPSGWSPNQRWQRVEAFYAYVVAAYPEPQYVEAAILLGELYKRQGKLDEAVKNLAIALERDPESAVAKDLHDRAVRLKDGKDEFEPVESSAVSRKKTKVDDSIEEVEVGDGIVRTFSATMTKEERDKAFFAAMAEEKRKKKESEKRKEDAKVATMTEEERARYDAEQDAKSKHDAKKDKVLKNHLAAYGHSPSLVSLRGGRGRGRGKS